MIINHNLVKIIPSGFPGYPYNVQLYIIKYLSYVTLQSLLRTLSLYHTVDLIRSPDLVLFLSDS